MPELIESLPASCQVLYKLRSEPFTAIRVGTILSDPDVDVDAILAGNQAIGQFSVDFLPAPEVYDLFYRSLNDVGEGSIIKLSQIGVRTTLNTSIDNVTTSLIVNEIVGSTFNVAYKVDDILHLNKVEYVVVTGIVDNMNGTWTITVNERGAHGTAAIAHNAGVRVESYLPTTPYNSIVLDGIDVLLLPAPTNLKAEGTNDGITLRWDWAATTEQKKYLKTFVLYYDTAPGIDENDAELVLNTSQAYVFVPRTAQGLPNITDTFHMRVAARSTANVNSALSNEVSAKVQSATIPVPGGPPTPTTTIRPRFPNLVKVEARVPSGANRVANIASATIELYKGSSPSTDPVPADPQIFSVVDNDDPFAFDHVISEASQYGDYWARAKFTDDDAVDGSWGLSAVITIDETTFTTDTGVVARNDIIIDVDVHEVRPGTLENSFIIGVTAEGAANAQTVTELEIQTVQYQGTPPTFDETNLFDAWPTATGPQIKRIFGGTYAVFSTPFFSSIHKYQVTARVKNAFGYSQWRDPVDAVPQLQPTVPDNDVAKIKEFAAWTDQNPPPSADSKITGLTVRFDITLEPTHNNTTFQVLVLGHTSKPFPSETVLLSQTGASAVVSRGTASVTVSGYSATLNEFQGKVFRMGRLFAINNDDVLNEFVISSNTAGNPFTITLSSASVANDGTLTFWSIPDTPLRRLVAYRKLVAVDTTGFDANPKFDIELPPEYVELNISNGLYFGAIAFNIKGTDVVRYADGTQVGTTNGANAVLKKTSGVRAVDSHPETQPLGSDLDFTPIDHRSFSWSASKIFFTDGSEQDIDAGSSGTLTTPTSFWIYATIGSNTLSITNAPLNAFQPGRILVGWARTTITATEFCTVISRWGGRSFIGQSAAFFNEVSAFFASFGVMVAGIVRGVQIETDESPNARVQLTSAGGLESFDSTNTRRIQLPTSGAELIFKQGSDVDGTGGGKITFDGISEIFEGIQSARDYLTLLSESILMEAAQSASTVTEVNIASKHPDTNDMARLILKSGSGTLDGFGADRYAEIFVKDGTTNPRFGVLTGAKIFFQFLKGATVLAQILGNPAAFEPTHQFNAAATDAQVAAFNALSGASTTNTLWQIDGANRISFDARVASANIWLLDVDFGSGVTGPQMRVGRNDNATPSAGSIRLTDKGGTNYYLWVDDDGKLRIHTSAPTNSGDTAGTVVGTQS